MPVEEWLIKQKELYSQRDNSPPNLSTHPISGEWIQSEYLTNKYWWGGGASIESCRQFEESSYPPNIGVISFGPVQSFLGGGQRLRDWAVASWLCHYLTGVLIKHWIENGGKILLPLYEESALVDWLLNTSTLTSEKLEEEFWQASFPNVVTGLFPDSLNWLENIVTTIKEEWSNLLYNLEKIAVDYEPKLLNGHGWKVIHEDNKYLWSVYYAQIPKETNKIVEQIRDLHQEIESQKLGRAWSKKWWGGRTSPSAGYLSIWHPGLKLIDKGGTWGLPDREINNWWESAAKKSQDPKNFNKLAGLFSSSDRLNSIELVKRLASVPEIIMPTLERRWEKKPPKCPWGKFPDRTAIAAAWIYNFIDVSRWNEEIGTRGDLYFENKSKPSWSNQWGIKCIDKQTERFAHPRVLERRNIDSDYVEDWDDDNLLTSHQWDCTREWTVGWRGDGDQVGKWLSGKQYEKQNLPWSKWHLDLEKIKEFNLNMEYCRELEGSRQVDLPHLLDLSRLFSYWNTLLYRLSEENYDSKVIFAGGDDFLILGPITQAISLTDNLHKLWIGEETPVTQTLKSSVDGWVKYDDRIYPVPGKKMTFSLGVVIAQRRIPQSLWHQGLNQAYKEAKNQGRDRVCVQVLFNSGQSLQWVCPWPLWELLMSIKPNDPENTELNCWEKLLFYFDNTRLQKNSVAIARKLIDTLWASVGLPLCWEEIRKITKKDRYFRKEIGNWQWWVNWLALRGFLARQARERENWQKLVEEK